MVGQAMCSCSHGVSTAAMASSSSLQLRLCALPSSTVIIPPSLLLPSRILHPPNSSVARCTWSRISFATLREDVTISRQQLQQESSSSSSSSSSEQQQQQNGSVASKNLNGAGALGVERPRNGTLNGNSSAGRELVEEFLFTQEYLEALDYDSVVDKSNGRNPSVRRKIWVKVDASATRLRPKSGSSNTANVRKRERKGGRVLPASIAEVLPLKSETNIKFYGDLYASLLRAGRYLPNSSLHSLESF